MRVSDHCDADDSKPLEGQGTAVVFMSVFGNRKGKILRPGIQECDQRQCYC